MRKIATIFTSLLVLSLVICIIGCGGGGGATPTPTPTTTPTLAPTFTTTPTPTPIVTTTPTPALTPTPTPSPVSKESERGYRYLEDNLNSSLNLIRESPDTGTPQDKTYYLVTDNLLASYALKLYDPGLSKTLMSTIERYGYQHHHYVEILFGNRTIEPIYTVTTEAVEENDDYLIKTEKVTDTDMKDYYQYLDRLCYEALWKAYGGDLSEASTLYNKALNMWDGIGFKDIVYQSHPEGGYQTYKLAVFYYTAKALGMLHTLTFKGEILSTISGLQASNGGFYTCYNYDDNGKLRHPCSTNTETTSLVLIALNYGPEPLPP